MNFSRVKTYSIDDRPTKSEVGSFAKIPSLDWRVGDFLDGLPEFLKASEFKGLLEDIHLAKVKGKARILLMGAHSLKVGLAPIIVDLIENGFITHLGVNGAVLIHDYEFAFYGRSSENVAETLSMGMFGMVEETPQYLNSAVSAASDEVGLGETIGSAILNDNPRFLDISVVVAAVKNRIPITVHIAIGADTIHQHPSFEAGKWGKLSGNDFYTLVESCRNLDDGGVVINLGSAVILPEVFLKALNLSRNLYGKIDNFSAANIDMIQHYRPVTNVVNRPTSGGGNRYTITSHFEIILPLIAWGLKYYDKIGK